ncbi:MAG: hypothetical protein R3B09_03915 [Nannocystaceae bacterium]
MKTLDLVASASTARPRLGALLRVFVWIAPIAALTAIGPACGSPTKGSEGAEKAPEKAGADKPADADKPSAAAAPFIAPYLTIQETLADDSVDKLAELAASVVTGAESTADKPGVSEVLAGAGRVPAQDIETARVGFEKMSMGVISFLKANPDQQGGLEVVFCPMAFNNKGAYWVQKKGEVTNPYHGKMMLRCGDAVEWGKAPG